MLPGRLEETNFISLIKRWRDMWNNMLLDHLQSMRLVAGHGIRIQKLASGTVISADRSGGGAAPGAAAQDSDGGAFAVTIENDSDTGDPNWIIKLHNSNSESGIAGMVTVGSYRKTMNDQEWAAQEGVVYLDITYDDESEEYTIIFDLEDEVPDTDNEKRYILRIAEITYDSETESYTASQINPYGDIEVAGRWVK